MKDQVFGLGATTAVGRIKSIAIVIEISSDTTMNGKSPFGTLDQLRPADRSLLSGAVVARIQGISSCWCRTSGTCQRPKHGPRPHAPPRVGLRFPALGVTDD